jgi:hypothetical protein
MARFSSIIRDLNSRLDLPQPARSRVLLEIHADLEDLYEFYLQKGAEAAEAEKMAEERLGLMMTGGGK